MSSLTLDLHKAENNLRLSLLKVGIHNPPVAEVGFNMDVSGSFEDEHRDGLTNIVMARLVPWGLVFDPDKKLDVFSFSSNHGGKPAAYYVGEVTAENYSDYVKRNIIGKVPNWNGGTLYAPVLQMNRQHFGWIDGPATSAPAPEPKRGGLLGGLANLIGGGHSSTTPAPAAAPSGFPPKRKTLILFVTDGENDDHSQTMKVLQEMQDNGEHIYIQFFGINNDPRVKFEFLQEAADKFDNTGLYICRDIKAFANMSDAEVNDCIISDELIGWLKK